MRARYIAGRGNSLAAEASGGWSGSALWLVEAIEMPVPIVVRNGPEFGHWMVMQAAEAESMADSVPTVRRSGHDCGSARIGIDSVALVVPLTSAKTRCQAVHLLA
jgi:hypothetical protein